MNEQDIYEGIGQVDDDVLLRSEKKRRARRPWWAAAAAAVVAVAVAVGFFFPRGGDFDGGLLVPTAHAIAEAHYPEMAPYPDETAADFEAQYEAWREDKKQQERDIDNMEGLKAYAQASISSYSAAMKQAEFFQEKLEKFQDFQKEALAALPAAQ